jgi:xanthine/uracil permease
MSPTNNVEIPPVQSLKEISFFVWLARVSSFLFGLLAILSVSDVFNTVASKVMVLAGAVFGYVATWAMGQVPSNKQRAVDYSNRKK